MPHLSIGDLDLDITFWKGVFLGPSVTPPGMRPTSSSDEIFSYDCKTGAAKPAHPPATLDFEAAIWCRPPLPSAFADPHQMLSDEQRHELDRKAARCERALIAKSGLNASEFAQRLVPYFPKVTARVPVAEIQSLIPDYSFKVVLTVYWIHCHCQTNIPNFECTTNLRFPYAYEYDLDFGESCTDREPPDIYFPTHYFEQTEYEKYFEREGLRQLDAFQKVLEGLEDGPNGHAKPPPQGH